MAARKVESFEALLSLEPGSLIVAKYVPVDTGVARLGIRRPGIAMVISREYFFSKNLVAVRKGLGFAVRDGCPNHFAVFFKVVMGAAGLDLIDEVTFESYDIYVLDFNALITFWMDYCKMNEDVASLAESLEMEALKVCHEVYGNGPLW